MYSIFATPAARSRIAASVASEKAKAARAIKLRKDTMSMKEDQHQQHPSIRSSMDVMTASSIGVPRPASVALDSIVSTSSIDTSVKRAKWEGDQQHTSESTNDTYHHAPSTNECIDLSTPSPMQPYNNFDMPPQQSTPSFTQPLPNQHWLNAQSHLMAAGQAVPVAFPSQPSPFNLSQPSSHPYSHVLQSHQNPYSHLARRHRHGGGGGGHRPIRGPHRVPVMDEMEGQVDEGDNRSYHGRPRDHASSRFNAAVASSSQSACDDVVDLTQDYGRPIDLTQDSSSISYNAFPVEPDDPYAYDPYAAAFRAATSSSSSSLSVEPPRQRELTASQFSSLSKEQQAVILAIRKGESVFFSGQSDIQSR